MQTEQLLQNLAKHKTGAGNRTRFDHVDAATGWSVALSMQAVDALSVQLWDVTLVRSQESPQPSSVEFQAAARRVAERVGGLMEPLQILEVDSERRCAILRSATPTVWRGQRCHYELTLTGFDRAELRRYQAGIDPSCKRVPTAFVLTNEVLARFLEDITAALA